MDLADQWLNVPKLLTPEDIVNPNLDEQSMMTYLSQFPNAKLKPGAPLRQKTNPSKVRAYGPGKGSIWVMALKYQAIKLQKMSSLGQKCKTSAENTLVKNILSHKNSNGIFKSYVKVIFFKTFKWILCDEKNNFVHLYYLEMTLLAKVLPFLLQFGIFCLSSAFSV